MATCDGGGWIECLGPQMTLSAKTRNFLSGTAADDDIDALVSPGKS